jgi:isoquinoline 1-oxidoreductase beta subunit
MQELNRRTFLKSAATGVTGLVIGFHLPGRSRLAFAGISEGTALNAWLTIATDNSILIQMAKAEMGQNVYTTLPSLVAEELEADWSKVKVMFAPSQPEYGKFGPFTGGSSSTRTGYEALRTVGAAAREMLISAAAKRWQVSDENCYAKSSFIYQRGTDLKISFGDIAADAARLPVPEKPKLKKESEFKLIGQPVRRLDTPAKVNGTAEFAIDVKMPGLMCAAVKMAPVFGGDVANLTELKAHAPKGVQIVAIPNGVAAVAKNFWTAQKALDTLKIKFKDGPHAKLTSAQISQTLHQAAQKDAKLVTSRGAKDFKVPEGAKEIKAIYEVPYLAHATMEPMSCVAHTQGQKCEIWAGTQSPFFNKQTLSKVLKIPPDHITVHTVFLGGGFGRRAEQDFIVQAALISKAVKQPVKVLWSREQDMQHDFYRPAFVAHLEGVIDAQGHPVSWKGSNAGSSIFQRWFPDRLKEGGGHDMTSIEGFQEIHYAIPNFEVHSAIVPTTVPVGFWRSVGSSQNAFFVESFIDEMAHAAGKDPFEFRRRLLRDKPRHLAVLDKVAERSGWSKKLPAGQGRGIALAEAFGSIVAEVIEVSVAEGRLKIHKITCVYDCGPIVNPNTIEAQMQSGIIFGLSAALRGEITLDQGRVQQGNFDTYPVLGLAETPQIEVFRQISEGPMGGIGEPGTPPVAPALANAIFAATGKRIRTLPLEKSLA